MGNSRIKTAAYWIVTGVVAAACILGGAVDVAHPPDAVASWTLRPESRRLTSPRIAAAEG